MNDEKAILSVEMVPLSNHVFKLLSNISKIGFAMCLILVINLIDHCQYIPTFLSFIHLLSSMARMNFTLCTQLTTTTNNFLCGGVFYGFYALCLSVFVSFRQSIKSNQMVASLKRVWHK